MIYLKIAFLIISAFIINTLATMYLWLWFFVPLGLPAIGFWHAMGIGVFVGFITNEHKHTDVNNTKEVTELIVSVYVRPIVALVVGALIMWLMNA